MGEGRKRPSEQSTEYIELFVARTSMGVSGTPPRSSSTSKQVPLLFLCECFTVHSSLKMPANI